MKSATGGILVLLITFLAAKAEGGTQDERFEALGKRYLREFPALSPVGATFLGDHRFDGLLDEVTPEARERKAAFNRRYLKLLQTFEPEQLSRANQVDWVLLNRHLRAELWRLTELKEWQWNPLLYTGLTGGAVYSLLCRPFAPLQERLAHVADRLFKFPRLLEQVRKTLVVGRVPKVHAETAVKQNRGIFSLLDHMVEPELPHLPPDLRSRLKKALSVARNALTKHQKWLEEELLPKAAGTWRVGPEIFDAKLRFALQTPLSRQEIRKLAEKELRRARLEMYEIAKGVYLKKHPYTVFPEKPSKPYRQAIIRAALELAYAETPKPDRIVEAARRSLRITTEFVRSKDLVTVPPDPLEIIVMPEFRRGVSLAYCDSPGPLEVGQKTFYAVSPPPEDWTEEQVRSFLREYNIRSLHNLTIHEAMPGHFLQLAHSNRYPSKLRAVLSSGVFIEGWAVYGEKLMCEEGFLNGDPLMRLIRLKWLLRAVANAIIDQAVHCEGMTREEAMRLMIEDTFQEEREAAGKWIRAQLTSVQLSTYFVGYLEHLRLRKTAEKVWGDSFRLKRYHDTVLSFGSPPPRFVEALMFGKPIPR